MASSDISPPNSHHKCCQKQKLRRGLWSPDEDEKLMNHIRKHGPCSWSSVPELAGLQRCGKSCRLRWINYLRPNLKRGCFTASEEKRIVELHGILGNKWSRIASYFPGRTDNEIKNLWNSRLRKMLDQKSSSNAPENNESGENQKQLDSLGTNETGSASSDLLDHTLDPSCNNKENATDGNEEDDHQYNTAAMKATMNDIKCGDTESSSSQTLSSSSLSSSITSSSSNSSSSSSFSCSRSSNRNAMGSASSDLQDSSKQNSIERPDSSSIQIRMMEHQLGNVADTTKQMNRRNPPFNLFPFSLPPDLEQQPAPPQQLAFGGGGRTNCGIINDASLMNNYYMNHMNSSAIMDPMGVAGYGCYSRSSIAKPSMPNSREAAASYYYAMNMNGELQQQQQLLRSMSEPPLQMYEEDYYSSSKIVMDKNPAVEFDNEMMKEDGMMRRWVCVNEEEWKEMREYYYLWRRMHMMTKKNNGYNGDEKQMEMDMEMEEEEAMEYLEQEMMQKQKRLMLMRRNLRRKKTRRRSSSENDDDDDEEEMDMEYILGTTTTEVDEESPGVYYNNNNTNTNNNNTNTNNTNINNNHENWCSAAMGLGIEEEEEVEQGGQTLTLTSSSSSSSCSPSGVDGIFLMMMSSSSSNSSTDKELPLHDQLPNLFLGADDDVDVDVSFSWFDDDPSSAAA